MRILRPRLMSALAASAMVVAGMVSPAFNATAQAAVAGATHSIPWGGQNSYGVTTLCHDATGFSCTGGGYNGTLAEFGGSSWGSYWSYGSPGPNGTKHNCTTYAAYRLLKNGYGFPGWTDNANGWARQAASRGVLVDQNPIVGSIAQWSGGSSGHVAYVEAVTRTYIVITSDNFSSGASLGTNRLEIQRTSQYMPDNFIHFRDTYIGAIVQWDGDTKAQKTSWRVGADGRRHWLPSMSVYSCLVNGGVAGPYVLPPSVLDNVIPDLNGSWASCGADINGDGIVNVFDLSILESEYGTSGHRADLNLDGRVNATDLSILESQFGKAPTPVPIPAP